MTSNNYLSKNNTILEAKSLKKRFGGLEAVSNFSFSLKKGETRGLIGPNGAGKTTVFNLITGFYKPNSGKLFYKGKEITYESPDKRVSRGIGRTFQMIRMEKYVKVIDEVKIGFFRRINYNMLDILFQTPKYTNEEKQMEKETLEILNFLGIAYLANILGEDVPYGLQKRVSLARILAMKPEVLLLDEPSSGLNPGETKELVELISKIKEKYNLSIFIIEHDMSVIMSICNDIIAVNEGKIIGMGKPKEIQKNKKVIEAYLGGIS